MLTKIIPIFQELLVNSQDYGTLVIHGACCSQIGNEKEAIESYFSALTIDSTNNMAWIVSLFKNRDFLVFVGM